MTNVLMVEPPAPCEVVVLLSPNPHQHVNKSRYAATGSESYPTARRRTTLTQTEFLLGACHETLVCRLGAGPSRDACLPRTGQGPGGRDRIGKTRVPECATVRAAEPFA